MSESSRPTITLACIMKNELKNLPRFLESVRGCMDEIVLVDTGSTDGSIEWVKENAEGIAECPIKLEHFDWINDFGAARNYAFSKATKDFILWLDLDDCLHNKDAFIEWRNYAMNFTDMTFASYHYALDKEMKPIVSFVRERVFRRSLNPQWKYKLHEGVVGKPEWSKNYITTWAVNHMRDSEDIAQDKSRNIKILEEMQDLDSRMKFYYGKELYEAGRCFEAIPVLESAAKLPDLERHDRILALQHAAYACMASGHQLKDELREEKFRLFQRAIDFSSQGVQLDPHRAEFYTSIGDSYLAMGMLREAIPSFAAAKACINPRALGSPYEGAIYSFVNCYGELPSLQLAKIYCHMGDLDRAKKEAKECFDLYQNEEAKNVLNEVERISNIVKLDNDQVDVPDIVFTCPPQNAMEFDEKLYKEKGCGGSETALVEMARELKHLTNRPVKVFNMRKEDYSAESGVEYISNTKLTEYLSKNKPAINIAWRHNIKLTNAKTYLWCHDLTTQGVEVAHNFDKIMCLTQFHKDYVRGIQGVPDDKIYLTRNGINPDKFAFEKKAKNPNKIVWMSSADRGLDNCMLVMDEVVKEFPDAELHVYYGVENLYKYGPAMSALADRLRVMISERSYVKYHGFTEQAQMYREVSDAVIWIYCAGWVETSCITAMECLANGIFPIARNLGGLKNTLSKAAESGQAVLIDHENVADVKAFTDQDIKKYYNEVCKALLNRSWERISYDLGENSWKSVAESWVEEMNL